MESKLVDDTFSQATTQVNTENGNDTRVLNSIYYLEKELSRLEQYVRRESIMIVALPIEVENAELESTVITIFKSIGIKGIRHHHIDVHRLKNAKAREASNETTNVIVRFNGRRNALKCLLSRKELRSCTTRVRCGGLYFMEALCNSYRAIFCKCCQLKKREEVKSVWTFNGNIKVKFEDDRDEKPTIFIHRDDFEEFCY